MSDHTHLSADGEGGARDAGAGGLQVRSKVWIERDGMVLISEYRARLLGAIGERGSVASAATELGLPYRTAWKKLREMEEAAGVSLMESDSGGAAGGGSSLTAAGRELLDAFARISEPVAAEVEHRFRDELGSLDSRAAS